jgi:hypothetical protein
MYLANFSIRKKASMPTRTKRPTLNNAISLELTSHYDWYSTVYIHIAAEVPVREA